MIPSLQASMFYRAVACGAAETHEPCTRTRGASVEQIRRCTVAVEGVVQGVGFRPFVYRLAQTRRLAGYVRNDSRGVLIELQGQQSLIQRFLDALVSEAPAAGPRHPADGSVERSALRCVGIPVDLSRRDGHRPSSPLRTSPRARRACASWRPEGPAIPLSVLNCTGCGPRFTIIAGLPYDRERTTMAAFPLCAALPRRVPRSGRPPLSRRAEGVPRLRAAARAPATPRSAAAVSADRRAVQRSARGRSSR